METRKTKSGLKFREMIRINGKAIKSPFFQRKSDAKEWKRRKELEKSKALALGYEDSLINQSVSFSDYSKKYMNEYVRLHLSTRTYDNYESVLRVHLVPFFGNYELSKIRKDQILKFITKLKANGHNGKGVNLICMLLKAILNHAIANNYLINTPFKGIKPQKEDLKVDNYWTKKEIMQFLSSAYQSDHYPLYFLALHTGMRLSELCGLKWDRVDFALSQISITRTRDKTGLKETTKTKIKRFLPMTPEVKRLLLNLFNYHESEFVMTRLDGKPIDYGHVYRKLKRDQRNARMLNKISFHDLRHTFATQFMINGGNIFELQKILGHTKIDMTMRYAHFSPEHLHSATKHMDMGVKSEIKSTEPYANPKDVSETIKLLKRREFTG